MVGVALALLKGTSWQLSGHRLATYGKGNIKYKVSVRNEHSVGAARLAIALGVGCECSMNEFDILHLGIGRKFGVEAGYLDNEA